MPFFPITENLSYWILSPKQTLENISSHFRKVVPILLSASSPNERTHILGRKAATLKFVFVSNANNRVFHVLRNGQSRTNEWMTLWQAWNNHSSREGVRVLVRGGGLLAIIKIVLKWLKGAKAKKPTSIDIEVQKPKNLIYTYNSYPPSLTAAPTTMFFLHNLFLCSLMHERKCKLSKKFRYFGSRQQRWCLYLTTKREMVVIEGQ